MTSTDTAFKGFTCWSTESADEVLVVDAPMSSDGVFAATHYPIQISQRSFDSFADSGSGRLVSESHLIEELLGESPSGLTFLPVVGRSGTGKSHLIRWIYSRLPPDEKRKDVYIKRYQTSLRSVIEAVLDGLEGEVFDNVRNELKVASAGVNPKSAPRRLLSELANTIVESASDSDLEEEAYLKEVWPKILGDPVIVGHFLEQSTKIEDFINRRLSGATSREAKQLRLEVTDLPVRATAWQRAAEPTKQALGRINAEGPLRDASLGLLNEQLESAVQSLFGVGGRDLRSVFVEARRALADAGMELLIAVEDFVVLQGIQGDLLDALLEPAKRAGKLELCPVRALVAVTTGYFTEMLPDTAGTRAKFSGAVYSLDIDIASSSDRPSISNEDLHSFIARYLNAVRVGPEALDEAYTRGTGVNWVPSACEGCRFQEECHDGFGDLENYGLYPLNREVIDTVAQRIGGHFDPREMINLTRRILACAPAISHGKFPNAEFAAAMPKVPGEGIDNQVSEDVDQKDPANAVRRKLLLEYWGGNPTELVNLAPAIHSAFALPQLDLEGRDRDPEKKEPPKPDPAKDPWQLKPETDDFIAQVEEWSKGKRLVQGPARLVRDLIAGAVIDSIDWNAEFASRPDLWLRETFGPFAISLENAQGEGVSRPPGTYVVELKASPASALLVEGLVKFEEFGGWGFPRGADFHRRFLNWADDVANGLLDRLHSRAERVLGPLTELLAVEAIILGFEVEAPLFLSEVKNLVFVQRDKVELHGVGAWQRLMKLALEGGPGAWDRPRMVEEIELATGARQGRTGDLQAVDFVRLQPNLETIIRTWRPPQSNDQLPPEMDKHLRLINDLFDQALTNQLDSLETVLWDVGLYVDLEEDLAEVRGQFIEAATAAVLAGVFRPQHLEARYRTMVDDAKDHDIDLVRSVGEVIGSHSADKLTVLLAAAVNRGGAPDAIRSFVKTADEILTATQEKVMSEIGDISAGSNDELAEDLNAVLSRLEEVLDEFKY